jgi:hypothetical protein
MKRFLLGGVGLIVCALSLRAAEPATNATPTQSSGPKSYQIRNVKYAELLRPQGANAANGTRIVLYPAQAWKCMTWKLHAAGDSVFQLQNHFTSKTIIAKTNEAQVTLVQTPFAREPEKRPAWRFTKLDNGFYRISDVLSGEVLTARSGDSGVAVVLAPWDGKPEQEWELIETDPRTLVM